MLDLLRQATVTVDSIRTDGGTQSRVRIDPQTVADYADAMQGRAEFPPVIVYYDGSQYWLADGFHRVEAWKKAFDGKPIPADVRQGDRRDAILHSVGANDAHGLRRTNEDKRRAVLRLLEDEEWRNKGIRWIAAQAKVSEGLSHKMYHDFVSVHGEQMRKPDERTVTRNGTTYTQNTANIGQRAEVKKISIPTPKEEAKAWGGYPEEYESSVDRGQWIPIQEAQPEPTPDPLPPTNDNRLAVHFRSETPEHYTPQEIVDAVIACMGGIDTDPCSPGAGLSNVPATTHYTQADDGLKQPWGGLSKLIPFEILHSAQLLVDSLTTSQDFCRNCLATTDASDGERSVSNSNFSLGALESQIRQYGNKNFDGFELGDNPAPLDALVVLAGLLTTDNANAERITQEVYGRLVYHFDLDFQPVVRRAFLPGRSLSDALVDTYTAFTINQTSAVSQNFRGNQCVYHGLIIPQIGGFIKDCNPDKPFTVYLNPPYGRQIGQWLGKLVESYESGDVTEAIALVPARTDTQWWQTLRDYPVCLIGGRLRFGDAENAAPFPSAVFYLGENIGNFYRTFSGLGDIWQRVEPFCFGE